MSETLRSRINSHIARRFTYGSIFSDEKLKQSAKDAQIMKLYREHVLKEKPAEGGFVPLDMLAKPKPAPAAEKEVGTFGD